LFKRINIYHAGTDPANSLFAQQIVDRARSFAKVSLFDVDPLESRGYRRPFSFPGVAVWVLSKALLSKAGRGEKILRSLPERNLSGFQVFLICRGIDEEWLRREHSELSPLLGDVMVAPESAISGMLEELRKYRYPSFVRYLATDPIHVLSEGDCPTFR